MPWKRQLDILSIQTSNKGRSGKLDRCGNSLIYMASVSARLNSEKSCDVSPCYASRADTWCYVTSNSPQLSPLWIVWLLRWNRVESTTFQTTVPQVFHQLDGRVAFLRHVGHAGGCGLGDVILRLHVMAVCIAVVPRVWASTWMDIRIGTEGAAK